jgi:ABC-type polysaccharide/polyol phosphate transport system ATPase subunit
MFDINLGIDPDLSGYDNIRTRALLLGLSPNAIEKYLPEIVEFTELGDYLDMPVRTYSAGMILRLSFSVATCFRPEILLMDEWTWPATHILWARQKRGSLASSSAPA